MRRSGMCRHLLGGAATVVIVAMATPATAQTRTFDVPAGPATRTIPIFAKQAGAQIIGRASDLRGQRTNAVKGSFTLEQALARALEGTELGRLSTEDGVTSIGLVHRATGRAETLSEDADAMANRGTADILVIGSRSNNVDIRRTRNDDQPYVVFKGEDIKESQATTVEEFLRTRLPQNASPQGSMRSSLETARLTPNSICVGWVPIRR